MAHFLEDWLFEARSFSLLFRALAVASALALLSLSLFTAKHQDTARTERPSRMARRVPPSPLTTLARAEAPNVEGEAALDSDFSIEQAALTWSHRITDRDDNPSIVRFGSVKVQRSIVERVMKAAEKTEMDPALLMAIADKESNFSTTAHARTSSASGLFQFIDKTWLQALREFGDRHGHSEAAKAIAGTEESVSVAPSMRAKILNLRNDAYLSAALAGEVLKKESADIAGKIGRALTAGEVYLVHFLGPEDAARFIKAKEEAPQATAAALFPRPARANRPIFFDQSGRRAKTVGEVHEAFEAMMGTRTSRYEDVAQKLPTGVSAYAE